MKLYTSHKQLVITIIASVLFIGGAIYYTKFQNRPNNKDISLVQNSVVANDQNIIDISTTSEKWKDFFLNSSSTLVTKISSSSSPLDPNNLSTKLGVNFYTNIVDLTNTNKINDDATVQKTIDDLVTETVNRADKYKKYTLLDINIKSDNSGASLKEYAKIISASYEKFGSPRSELSKIVDRTDTSEGLDAFKDLGPFITSISANIDVMLKTAVPSDLSRQHLDFVNSLSLIKNVAQNLMKYTVDPAQTLVAMGNFVPAHDMIYKTMKEIVDYANTK